MKVKNLLFIISIILLIQSVNAYQYYTIPIQALSSSPADSVANYIGFRPNTPALVPGHNFIYFPSAGTIEQAEIYDYSGTAGTAEPYAYYIRINNNTQYLIQNRSVAANERVFTNGSLNININNGDYFEINRTHPAWATNPATNIVGGYILFNSTEDGYAIPIQSLTTSPADAALNFMGHRPIAPSTSSGTNKIYIPNDGNLTKAFIIDNSTGNSTAEGISVFISKNGGNDRRIATLAVNSTSSPGSTLQRQYNNTNFCMTVSRGDYIEVRRNNPTWVYDPLTAVTSGLIFINTSISRNLDGYMLFVEHITTSTTDAQTVYFGNSPKAPTTTAAINKVYIRKNGIINIAELYVYSGTAGTAEPWSMYIRVNNANDYLIAQVNSSAGERLFKNTTMGISVSSGDYFEIKGVQPTWATNPATVITGGYVWVDYGSYTSGGGDIILPPVANFSANITSTTTGATLKFFDQSNNTIPGTTTYYWNFMDGGTAVNSTDENPTFVYAEAGTYTINHTVYSGGVMSKATGVITITGTGTPTGPPNASFSITLTDTSTNYPTSWKWNATNLLGNNTEVTFSTSQNPVMNFGTGNWKINFTATNLFGSHTVNQTIGYNLSSPRVYFWNRTA